MAPVLAPTNILGIVGLVLLMVYIAHDMPPAVERRSESLTLRYDRLLRWFALFSFGVIMILVTLIVIGNPPKRPGDGWCIIATYVLGGTLSGVLLRETTCFAVTFTDRGLECRSGWRRRRFVPWEEITGLTTSEVLKYYTLHTRSGYRFHLPMNLVPGLPFPLEMLKGRLAEKNEAGKHP